MHRGGLSCTVISSIYNSSDLLHGISSCRNWCLQGSAPLVTVAQSDECYRMKGVCCPNVRKHWPALVSAELRCPLFCSVSISIYETRGISDPCQARLAAVGKSHIHGAQSCWNCREIQLHTIKVHKVFFKTNNLNNNNYYYLILTTFHLNLTILDMAPVKYFL